MGLIDDHSECLRCHAAVPIGRDSSCPMPQMRSLRSRCLKGQGNNVMFSIALNPFLTSCRTSQKITVRAIVSTILSGKVPYYVVLSILQIVPYEMLTPPQDCRALGDRRDFSPFLFSSLLLSFLASLPSAFQTWHLA